MISLEPLNLSLLVAFLGGLGAGRARAPTERLEKGLGSLASLEWPGAGPGSGRTSRWLVRIL